MLPVAAPVPQITLMFDEDLDTLQTCIQQNSEKAFNVLFSSLAECRGTYGGEARTQLSPNCESD